MNLRRKLIFISFVTFVILIILGSLFQIPVQKRQEQIAVDGIIRLLDILIESQNGELSTAILNKDQKEISSMIESMLHIQGVDNVILYDADKYMIDFALESDTGGAEVKSSVDYDNAISFSEEKLYRNKASIQYEHMLQMDGATTGFIQIFYSLEEIKNQSLKSLFAFILSISLSLFITFVFMFFMLTKAVVSPLTRLNKAVKEMNLDDPEINLNALSVDGDDEVGELTYSINQLAKKINNYSTALQKQNKQLIKSQKMEMIGTLTGGLAHDFNNILGGVIGSVSLLKLYLADGDLTDQKLTANLEIIDKSARRATEVVRKLMDFSRKQTETESLRNLNTIAKDVLDIFSNTVDKSLKLEIFLSDANLSVSADSGQIEQVILNLCINAAHSMTIMKKPGEKTGGVLSVKSGRVIKDGVDYCFISISDTGIGIDEKNLGRIFDPFYTTKIEEGGSGLGLSMVSSIIARHRGLIDVESVVGSGTTFSIYLPFTLGDVDLSAEEDSLPLDKSEVNTILLVDDEEILREVSMEILSECGYKVLQASSGQEALDVYKNNRDIVDLIILDMAMPGMSGDEVYTKLKSKYPDIKILISSGSGITEGISGILENPNTGFIKKPYTIEDLSKSIFMVVHGEDSVR